MGQRVLVPTGIDDASRQGYMSKYPLPFGHMFSEDKQVELRITKISRELTQKKVLVTDTPYRPMQNIQGMIHAVYKYPHPSVQWVSALLLAQPHQRRVGQTMW